MTKPRLFDVLGAEALRNRRDLRALWGQLKGQNAPAKRLTEIKGKQREKQLGLALKFAAMQGDGSSVSLHAPTCKTKDHTCKCAVLVLTPGALA